MSIWFRVEEIHKNRLVGYNPGVGQDNAIFLGDEFDTFDRDEPYSRRDELEEWDWVECRPMPAPLSAWKVVDGSEDKPEEVNW